MNFTLITPTCDRPEAFAICEKWMARQTLPFKQWFVLDDGHKPAVCTMGQTHVKYTETRGKGSLVNKLRCFLDSNPVFTGDAVAIIEDDDYYSANYLEVADARLNQGFDFIGEGHAMYYNVRSRRWSIHSNAAHASFCQTVIRNSAMYALRQTLNDTCPFIDVRIWRDADKKLKRKVFLPGQNLPTLVGIKGIYQGYGVGHTTVMPNRDPDMVYLRRLIGNDFMEYARFGDKSLIDKR